MTIDDLIMLVSNKLTALNSMLATATINGDIAEVVRLQSDIENTTMTLGSIVVNIAKAISSLLNSLICPSFHGCECFIYYLARDIGFHPFNELFIILNYPLKFRLAGSYISDNITFKLWVDKQLLMTTTVTDMNTFRLPTGYRSDTFEVGVTGDIRVRAIHLGETPLSLKEA